MSKVTVSDQQGHTLEDVSSMVSSGPVNVPGMASITHSTSIGSLGQLSTPGQYILNVYYNQ